jgi:YbgC/YbaW family acyl-CoA thioester hydrolase
VTATRRGSIVFHPRYLAYFDHGTNLLFTRAGFDLTTLPARFEVIGFPVVDLRTRFLAPCRFGDEVRIDTRIASSFAPVASMYSMCCIAVRPWPWNPR